MTMLRFKIRTLMLAVVVVSLGLVVLRAVARVVAHPHILFCSAGDGCGPDEFELELAQVVVTHSDNRLLVSIGLDASWSEPTAAVPPGVRCAVVREAGFDSDDRISAERSVSVQFLEGPRKGQIVRIRRNDLRVP